MNGWLDGRNNQDGNNKRRKASVRILLPERQKPNKTVESPVRMSIEGHYAEDGEKIININQIAGTEKLRSLITAAKRKLDVYLLETGNGPNDEEGIQNLPGFNFVDLNTHPPFIDLLSRPGVALLALGSFGGANGKTHDSHTGRTISNFLVDPSPYSLCFIDILMVYVKKVKDFNRKLFTNKSLTKLPSYKELKEAMRSVVVEALKIRHLDANGIPKRDTAPLC